MPASTFGSGTRVARSGTSSAIDRSALDQAFRDAGKMAEARQWAAELVKLLKSGDLLT
jgi:hypothetical protein